MLFGRFGVSGLDGGLDKTSVVGIPVRVFSTDISTRFSPQAAHSWVYSFDLLTMTDISLRNFCDLANPPCARR